MKRMRQSLVAVVPCVIVGLCALAIAAPAAQAEGNWKIEGKNLAEKVEIEGEKDKGPYGFLIPDLGFSLVFETFAMDNGSITTRTATALFFNLYVVISSSPSKEPWETCSAAIAVTKQSLCHENCTLERRRNRNSSRDRR